MYRKSMRTYGAFLILFLGTTFTLGAQGILFSKPFRAQNYANFEVLGKVGDNFIVLEKGISPYGKTILRVFDQQMKQVSSKKKLRLPPGASELRYLAYDSFLVKTYFQQLGNKFFLMAAIMDGFTRLEEAPIILDSMSAEAAAYPETWEVVPSQDKSKLVVLRIKYTYDSASISTTIFNARLKQLQSSDFKILLSAGHEVIGQFLISNQGDTYFTIQPLKGAMNRFEILSKPFTEKYYHSLLIDLKSKYLNKETLAFTIEESRGNGTLLINSTYYSNINSSVDEGFFAARVNAETNRSKAVFNPLKDSIGAAMEVSSSTAPLAHISLTNVFVLNNGGLMLVGELNRSRRTLVARPRNYLNQTIVNPRQLITPEFDSYFGSEVNNAGYYTPEGPQRVFINPREYDPLSKVELYNNDIVVCYLDSNLKLQRQSVVEKDQEDIKKEMPLYLGFAAVNTSSGIHLLYRELQRGGGILRNNRISPAGEMVRLPPLKTVYDTYKLILSSAKQVGLRQVIVPGMYKGKTVFAKIDL